MVTWMPTEFYPSSIKDGLSPEKIPGPSNVTLVMLSSNVPPLILLPLHFFVRTRAITRFGPTATAPTVSAPSIPCSIHFCTTCSAPSPMSFVGNVSWLPSWSASTRNSQSLDAKGLLKEYGSLRFLTKADGLWLQRIGSSPWSLEAA